MQPKYIEEQEVDSNDFAMLQSQMELTSTLKKLVGVLNSNANDKNVAQAIEKNNAAINGFVQVVQSLKFDPVINTPAINPPIVNVNSNQDKVIEAVNIVTENQIETNRLLRQLIDNKVTEWISEIKEWAYNGRIKKVNFKAVK